MLTLSRVILLCGACLPPASSAAAPEMEWTDARKLTLEGLAFRDLKAPYDRLPARAEKVVREAVWDLSRDSSGAVVRFVSNAAMLQARWTLGGKTLAAANITATAQSGLDLYVKTGPGKWRWLASGRPTKLPQNVETLVGGMPQGEREYMLYLPLRNRLESLEIGVPKGGKVSPAPVRTAKPIVFYGTSITHGISASRPGMTHVAMLGRQFDRPIVNLGFAGNGKMEPEVTKFIAEIDAAVFVLDCLPNMIAKEIEERAESCVKTLRAAHPKTPILLVEDRNYTDGWLLASRRDRNETNHAAMRKVYAKMQSDKVPHLYYLKADNLLGSDGDGAIDGSHPTDLGYYRQAAEFYKVLRRALK